VAVPAGMNAFLKPTTTMRSFRWRIISSISAARIAGGFSSHTSSPASSAWQTSRGWAYCETHTKTASSFSLAYISAGSL
jgi:hypothetical protein